MSTARRSALTALLAVIAVTVVVGSVLYAATTGPHGLLRDAPAARHTTYTPPTSLVPDCVTTDAEGQPVGSPTSGVPCPPPTEIPRGNSTPSLVWTVLGFLMTLLLLALLVLALIVGARRLLDWLSRRREREQIEEVDLSALPARSAALAEAVAASARERRAELMTGDARDAIVRCWLDLERQVAALGLDREEWQTPAEFTVAVMDGTGADSAALLELADCYRRARFSPHPSSERERERALHALDRLHTSLTALEWR